MSAASDKVSPDPQNPAELRLLLTLIISLGGAWLFLNNRIQTLGIEQPGDKFILPLVIAQAAAFTYLALALYAFYQEGLRLFDSETARFPAYIVRLLFTTWPSVVLAVLLSMVSVRFELPYLVAAILTGGVPMLFLLALEVRNKTASPGQFTKFLSVFAAVGLLYVPLMSELLAGVYVKTDKDFYTEGDVNVIVAVRSAGYLLRPAITTIEVGDVRQKVEREGTYSIPLSKIRKANYIQVEYTTQFGLHRRQFEWIRIAEPIPEEAAKKN
jgi:hypothetical protein